MSDGISQKLRTRQITIWAIFYNKKILKFLRNKIFRLKRSDLFTHFEKEFGKSLFVAVFPKNYKIIKNYKNNFLRTRADFEKTVKIGCVMFGPQIDPQCHAKFFKNPWEWILKDMP